ncbi:MAG: ABC transporter ATP-binding protein/permease [Firmicutes bacterium]|nr:ABC transporter ATP-binding protein/permease [Bacillota bacterium]
MGPGGRRPGGPGFGPGGGGPRGGMGMPVEKPKNFRKTFFRLLLYIKPHRLALLVVLLSAILGNIFNVLSPRILGQATTIIFEGMMGKVNNVSGSSIDFSRIQQILLLLIGLYFTSAMFRYLENFIMAGVSQRTVYGMRTDVSKKLSRIPLKFFDARSHGDILSRVTNDMDLIAGTLQQSMAQVIESAVMVVGVLTMMLIISPSMTLIALVTIPISFVITAMIAKRSQRYFAAQQKELGQLNGHVEEMYGGHLIVKAFNHEHKSIQEFNTINSRLYDASWKAQFVSGLIMPLLGIVNNIGYVLVAVVGGIFVTQGSITIGNVQAFIQYSRQFTHPIIQTANIANILQSTVAAAERVFEILDEEEETVDSEHALANFRPQGNVRFENVKFGYSEDSILMKDMNISVQSGQTIAIVGPTGAGKTTLVNLLMRFYEVNGGRITVDDIDILDIKRGSLRSIFGMVLQDTWLFKGTIYDNIAYGKEGATEEEIVRAATTAHADHFIRTLPDGYATVLNEEASNISQGQRQLITIARALLADPAILILDEATSSVDTRTEILIQKAMKKLMQGRTNFVIAHRLSTIRDADLILVMNEGDVVEKGTNAQLLEMNGFYADIYNSQFTEPELYGDAG